MSIPYKTRAEILMPILNKLNDTPVSADELREEYNREREDIKIGYEEF